MSRSVALLLVLLLLSCSDDSPGLVITGEYGDALPLELHHSLLVAQVSVDGSAERAFLVDTGAQYVLLDLPFADELGYPAVPSPLNELTIGALTFAGVDAVAWDLTAFSEALGVPLAGVLGASLFSQVSFAVDTQRRELRFLESDEESVLDEEQVEPTPLVTAVTSRYGLALAETTVEGSAPAQLVLDTGASNTFLFESLFVDLDPTDRPVLTGLEGLGAAGAFDLELSRLCGLAVGEATLDDVHIGVIPADALGDMTTVLPELRGLVGATFFREFLTVFDLPAREVRFYRYRDRSHIPSTELVQLGIELERTAANDAIIVAVFAGTDAERQGLTTGEVVLTIDGVATRSLDDQALIDTIHGVPGESRTLELETGGTPETVAVMIEDLMPPCE